MRRVVPGLVACVLVLAGCAGAGVVQGQPDCGHVTAGGKAAVFFVNPGAGTGACGYTYAGKPAGRLLTYPPCGGEAPCVMPGPSPDGHHALGEFTVTDTASGRVVARLPDEDVVGYVWASDSRHLCGVLGGPAVPVVLVVAGLGGRPEQVTLAPLFTRVRYSGIGLVVCDPRHARAVLQASYWDVTAVAVVSLSDGAVLAEHDFPDTGSGFPDRSTPVVTRVVASADGRYLAVLHSIQPASGSPGPGSPPTVPAAPTEASPTGGPGLPIPAYLDVFDINHPGRPIARLAAAQAVAFPGDGALLAEQVPRTHGGEVTRVVRWSDGQIIWQSNGTLAGAVSSPGAAVIAIAIYQPGWSSNQIVLVRPDGQSIPVADGQLAGP